MDPFDLSKWKKIKTVKGDCLVDQIVIDSRRISSPNALFVALPGESEEGHSYVLSAALKGAKFAIVKKGWTPPDLPDTINLIFEDSPLKALQSIAAFYRRQKTCKMVAIIGTHGKTLTKDLLEAILKKETQVIASPESFNSQIGVPLSLLTIKNSHKIALIEAAVSKPGEMDDLMAMIKPDACLLTHVGDKHLTTLPTKDAHLEELIKALTIVPESGWILLPEKIHHPFKAKSFFSTKKAKNLPFAAYLSSQMSPKMAFSVSIPQEDPLQGEALGNFTCLLPTINSAAIAAFLLGASTKAIKSTLEQYTLVPHQKEMWKTTEGTLLINDKYSQDPLSIEKSLKNFYSHSLKGKKIFVFGGLKEIDPGPALEASIISAIDKAKVHKVLLVGKGRSFEKAISEMRNCEVKTFLKEEEAFKYLREKVKPQDSVLFKGEQKIPLNDLFNAFHDAVPSNRLIINLSTMKSNIAVLRAKLPPKTELMPMVKGFAYGTDSVLLSQFFSRQGIKILGVSHVEEGVSLKRAGVSLDIFTFHAAPYEARKAVKWDLQVGISDEEQLKSLQKEAFLQGKEIKVHLHVDTGMNRLGCPLDQAVVLAKLIEEMPNIKLVGMMTHFSAAEKPEFDSFTKEQLKKFERVLEKLKEEGITPALCHVANTPAAVRFYLPKCNLVRVALALFGFAADKDFRPAIHLQSSIVGFNVCFKGDSVSYGRHYRVKRDKERIAILPIGYVDGIHRSYSEKGYVLIRGKKAPMVGKINMDFMMVDVTEIPEASIGDTALIFGEDDFANRLETEEFATKLDSVVQELMSCIGPRIQRIFIDEE